MSDSELTYSADHVQRLLQCSVCLDRFRQPKLLPCQHTFCLSPCLEGLVDRRTRMLRCPECRADHLVPRGGPSRFPNNLTIISFLELPHMGAADRASASSAGASSSSRPSSDVPLSSSAPSCLTNASERPDRFHFESRRAAGLGSAAGGREAGVEGAVGGIGGGGGGGGGGCSACHTEGRLGRCSHCDQLLCEPCKRAHMDMVRSDVNRLVGQVRQALPQITEHINQIGRKGVQLQSQCENIKVEIAEVVDKHIRELKIRQRLLKDDVDSFLVSELRGLRTHQESLEVELASMASFCDSTESTLSRGRHLTNGDLVELRRQCIENMETLRDYENGTLRPPVPRNMQLSAESQFMSTSISNFGELIITSGSSSIHARGAASRDQGVTERRTTLRTPETATDYALSVLSPRSPSLSPNIPRRQSSPIRAAARPSQMNIEDEDLYDEEEEEEAEHSLPRLDSRRRHRRDRRERLSDTRISSVLGRSSDLLLSRHSRNIIRRHRSLGGLSPSNDSSDQSQSSPERTVAERGATQSRRRAFETAEEEEDDVSPVGIGRAPSLTYPPRRSARGTLRFDLPPDTSSETEDTPAPPRRRREPEENQAYMMWADNSPSMYVTTPRNKYNQKGQAMTRFGERGNGCQQFSWPRGVAVSPLDDSIFVADSSNHRVQIFDNTGAYTRHFGLYGQGEGEFDCLAGITVNGLGQIIIADRYNHRIQIFDRGCSFQRSFGSEGSNDGQLNYPWGVACDNMGFIYVCDKENHRIQVFQSNGAFVRKFGRLGSSTGFFDNPHYVAVSPDNKVYVSDSSNHRVQVFSIYGDFLFSFGSCGTLRGQMKFPRGIAIDNQGFVVVADSGNNRVQIFRADGRYYSMFGAWGTESGQFKGLEGLAILANGNVVVTDRENHRIQIF